MKYILTICDDNGYPARDTVIEIKENMKELNYCSEGDKKLDEEDKIINENIRF